MKRISENRKILLKRALFELEQTYPKDDWIITYADFIKNRNYICFHQFNPKVFHNLLELINQNWTSDKRINRLSLLKVARQYLSVAKPAMRKSNRKLQDTPVHDFDDAIKLLVLEVFRKTVEFPDFISRAQLMDARKLANSLMMNMTLPEEGQLWLCQKALESPFVLNRLLRYPHRSEVISNWIRSNYYNDNLRHRRAEVVSWIIDDEPDFEIDQQTLISDFEWQNNEDIKAIQEYDDEMAASDLIESEFGDFLSVQLPTPEVHEKADRINPFGIGHPSLQLSKRFYPIKYQETEKYPVAIPDFTQTRNDFEIHLPTYQKATMIWAIFYSRLDTDTKVLLLKKYYNADTFPSILKVARRLKTPQLLKWMLDSLS